LKKGNALSANLEMKRLRAARDPVNLCTSLRCAGGLNLIYSRKWIRVFWTCLIEIGVVDAHSKLPVCLRDHDRIGQPHWVVDLLDEASLQQLADLFTDEVLPDGLLPRLLSDRSGVGPDLQMVLNHLPRDPGYL
jgi:hypothetical protein